VTAAKHVRRDVAFRKAPSLDAWVSSAQRLFFVKLGVHAVGLRRAWDAKPRRVAAHTDRLDVNETTRILRCGI
jgi:hypothetical protein